MFTWIVFVFPGFPQHLLLSVCFVCIFNCRPDHLIGTGATGLQRRKLYCHRSPTDKLLVQLGMWLDDAVPRMPNRYQGLQSGHLAGKLQSFSLHLSGMCTFGMHLHLPYKLQANNQLLHLADQQRG